MRGMGNRVAGWQGSLIMAIYSAQQGDIIMMDFTPQSGHEQSGRRPAIVVSNDFFNRVTNMALVCPITNTLRPFPLHIALDERSQTTGSILCEQVKSLDLAARRAEFKEKAPVDIVNDCIERITLSLDPSD